MRKAFILVGIALSCFPKIERYARGEERRWVIVYSDDLRRVATHLQAEMFRIIQTPQPESLFKLTFVTPDEFQKNWKGHKNIIILATPSSKTFNLYLSVFPEPRQGLSEKNGGFVRDDYVIGLFGEKEEGLYGSLTAITPILRDKMIDRVMFLYSRLSYYPGRNKKFANTIREEYGYKIDLPDGWSFVKEEENFLCMAKHNPDQFFFIYRESAPRALDPKGILDLRDELTAAFYDGDYSLRDLVEVEETRFRGNPAMAIWGVWQNDQRVAGGPFKLIAFNEGGKFYMIDMAVFAPEKPDKLQYIFRMEAFLRSFEP
ncbi:MAG: DUF4837 family protein [candidate division WOR-3 bacterium]